MSHAMVTTNEQAAQGLSKGTVPFGNPRARGNKVTKGTVPFVTLAALAAALSLALAPAAFAMEGHAVSSGVSVGADGAALVNVAGFSDAEAATVFVTLESGGAVAAELVPHGLAGEGEGSASVLAVQAGSADELASLLEGGLTVHVYADEAGSELLFEGTAWPVWANLDGRRVLIGSHTGSGAFAAPESVADAGRAWRLADDASKSGEGALTFAYEAFDPSGAVEGSIRYVDIATGQQLETYTPIPGLEAGADPREVVIPAVVDEGGALYRTVSLQSSVQVQNPGATSFIVPAARLTDAGAAAAGHYLCTIKMVDGATGAVIASDAVMVRGEATYTLPDSICVAAASDTPAATYTLAQGQQAMLTFSAATDGVTSGERTVEAYYALDDEAGGVAVTFVLQDGTKRVGDASRMLGTYEAQASADNATVAPPATFTDASGAAFELVGEPADYAYEYGSGAATVIDAYYLPAGYSAAQEAYEVTVRYVDFATGDEIDSESFTSSPDSLGWVTFEPPAQFEHDGVTWLRLDGQGAIEHHYYSHAAEYTVYYRDRSKPLESVPVITRVRVVYRDGGVTYVDGGTVYTYTGAGAAGATGAAGSVGADARLDASQSYGVAQGQGTSQQAIGSDGRDAAQQRIDESQTPLTDAADAGSGLPMPAIVAAALAALAAIAALVFFLLRRRRNDE